MHCSRFLERAPGKAMTSSGVEYGTKRCTYARDGIIMRQIQSTSRRDVSAVIIKHSGIKTILDRTDCLWAWREEECAKDLYRQLLLYKSHL